MKKSQASNKDPNSELTAALQKINSIHPPKLAPGSRPFMDYAWDDFDVRHVLEILLSEEPSYYGHKDILFAGLCGWVVAPIGGQNIIRSCMALRAMQILNEAEMEVPEEIRFYPAIVDLYVRAIKIGPEFFSDFYYPAGGLHTLLRTPAKYSLQRQIKRTANGATTVITCMDIMHYHVLNLLAAGQYGEPSINKCSKIVSKIILDETAKLPAPRTVLSFWYKFRPSISLLYAASHVKTEREGGLLGHLIEGTANYASHGRLLSEWIAKSRYVNWKILSENYEQETMIMNEAILPDGQRQDIPDPALFEQQVRHIERLSMRKGR